MDKQYSPKNEARIYDLWEKNHAFTPKIDHKKKPYSILLPLPNANDSMHMGHALFTIQDILIRYHRMLGDATLWLPGGDHAGIETQYVFEKKLAKEGKSRFDYNRNTLYKLIENYVEKNKNLNCNQLKQLGFSLDWSRYHYSLEPKIVQFVVNTFIKLNQDKLVYRAERLVNFCTKCGTAFSDLEIKYQEQKDPLYYLKYGPLVLATVRPETKFGDTAVAVNPLDKRYQKWVGKTVKVQGLLGKFSLKVISDEAIDPKFATGVAKVTPAHDFTDYEIAKRHNLAIVQIINREGRLNQLTGPYAGLKIKPAREKIVADLQKKGLIVKIDQQYLHSVATCYKCGSIIEPMLIPQWYVKTKSLAEKALAAVKKGKTKIVPLKRFQKMYFQWLENITDWNISRSIVWGPRIPAWYSVTENPGLEVAFINAGNEKISGKIEPLLKKYQLEEIKKGLQQLIAPCNANFIIAKKSPGANYLQDTDTFDTWFLSSQWPLTTLGFPDSKDFKYFYPTSVLDTLWDILFFWVARMMMIGLYYTNEVPFKIIHLHSRVVDQKGQKMAKSKGNVINPIEKSTKFGADALRFAFVFGVAPGSDIVISDDKVRGMRNFTNKVWNIGRFVEYAFKDKKNVPFYQANSKLKAEEDQKIIKDLNKLILETTKHLDKFQFSLAAEKVYAFIWHNLADKYLEIIKPRIKENDSVCLSVLRHVYLNCLKLLHPFMPFVTEAAWQQMPRKYKEPLIVSSWPRI